ncbi:MAG TPA: 6-pyruvoyl tetrahydropterin synthase family protein, partial [Gemmatales bacterium]|nr:6-pyruvoyl tetrahydropterin synthase family protein [Gemmatales bacterium]
MAECYTVRVTKDHLVFCSGHFITYEGSQCERLHGHNYRVAVEVSSPLDLNHYVFDFIALKKITMRFCDELDHRMLLPTRNPLVQIQADQQQVTARFKDKYWSFPAEDCVLLPIENTTAELLAKYLGQKISDTLQKEFQYSPPFLAVEVEESFG